MNNELEKIFSLKEIGGKLSFYECQVINEYLSKIDIAEIPEDQRDNVKEYLCGSLNMNSVDAKIINSIENLFRQLEK